MTSLVDVIFLLLLFFMLTSTFSEFSEVKLAAASDGADPTATPPIFLQLFPERLTVNGQARPLDGLALPAQSAQTVFVALQEGVTAQRLTDLLVALRRYPDLSIAVLGAG